jgi:hypothetical protein
MKTTVGVTLGVLLLAGSMSRPARAQETAPVNPEIERLKVQLAAQQQQIEQMRQALDEQKKVLDQMSRPAEPKTAVVEASRPRLPNLGEVASTTPVLPPLGDTTAPLHPGFSGALGQAPGEEPPSPLQVHIGTATITPVGFMDLTEVFRSKDIGSSIGTNFGGTPYGNTPLGNLSESRLSAQNSRVGARIDALVHGAHVIGYWESDFLGTQGTNAAVTSNSNSFRIRLYWVDVRKGQWEILGGQSWSLLTPNRKGLSPLPADLFYTQDMDTNYQVGLTWTRAPQFRLVYHPSDIVSWGLSLEAAEQYGGGTNGAGTITLPSALATSYASEINTGATTFNVPNAGPDIQSKIAFDPTVDGKLMHIEFAGLLSFFRTYNPTGGEHFTKTGGGGEANFNLELIRNFHLIVDTFVSDGGGRYLFGSAPDLIVLPNGGISPLHADSALGGFEYTMGKTILFAYYGADYIGKDSAVDTTNKNAYVGYGFPGSSTSNNRTIQEATFGLNQTLWKNPNYGALGLIFQYSYLFRNPWSPPATGPTNANNNMVWIDLRYTLPGQAPTYR